MKLTVKRLTVCALLTAAALTLSYLESLLPLNLAVPIPGIKPGFANIVMLLAMCILRVRETALILTARCLMGAMFAGNMSAILFSLLGGASSLLVMHVLMRRGKLSVYGISTAGAAAHNCGQIAAAMVVLGSTAPIYYLPVLLLASLFTGSLTALVAARLLPIMERSKISQMLQG